MSKISIIKWVVVIVIIAALGFMGWYFSRTNSITSQTGAGISKTKSSEKSITSFSFAGIDLGGNELIDNNSHTITVMVPKGTNLTGLTPIILVAGNAKISPDSGAVQNFTDPVVYTVTAQDGSSQNYTVTLKKLTGNENNGGS